MRAFVLVWLGAMIGNFVLGQERVPYTDLSDAYTMLLDSRSFCEYNRAALITDKPIYRNGETVYVTLYFYNFMTKRPNSRCRDNQWANLQVLDNDDKNIASLDSPFNQMSEEEKKGLDLTSQTFEWKVPANLAGGSYKIRSFSPRQETIKIFVLRYEARSMALVGDWSQENAKAGDTIRGKLTLKSFNQTPVNAKLSYVFSSGGKTLDSRELGLEGEAADISFTVPKGFERSLIFRAEVLTEGQNVNYQKEFLEPSFDDVVIDFTIGTGRLTPGFRNNIYFVAWENKERKIELPIIDARVIRRIGNRVEVVETGVRSTVDGKGKFSIPATADDFSREAKFVLEVQFDALNNRSFTVIDLKGNVPSPLLMSAKRLVNGRGAVEVLTVSADYAGPALLALINKGKILHKIDFSIQSRQQNRQTFNLTAETISVGGVFTLGLFIPRRAAATQTKPVTSAPSEEPQKSAKVAGMRIGIIRPPVVRTPGENMLDYLGEEVQEMEIFVIPSKTLSARIDISPERIFPGDEIEYSITMEGGESKGVRALVDVIDESAFVEVEKARESPSLFTKGFLENEIKLSDGIFLNAYKYIDDLFDLSKRAKLDMSQIEARIDALLGCQSYRKFLFDPKVLEDFLLNRYNGEKYEKVREDLEKLLYSMDYNNPSGCGGGGIMYARAGGPVAMAMAVPMMAPMAMGGAENAFADNAMPVPPGAVMKTATVAESTKPAEDKKSTKSSEDEAFTAALKEDNILHRSFGKVEGGTLRGKLRLPDRTSTFSFRVHLVDEKGAYGFTSRSLSASGDFSISFDAPIFIYRDEPIELQVSVQNNLPSPQRLFFRSPASFSLDLPSNRSGSFRARLTPDGPLNLDARDARGARAAARKINTAVVNPGVLRTSGTSALVARKVGARLAWSGKLPATLIPGQNSLRACHKNSALALILDAVRTLNKQPVGCFEQASSANFPLILGVKILDGLPSSPELKTLRAEMVANIRKGVELLLGYECKETGGFEWFGKAPCHSTLTAYGLWQFLELSDLPLSPPVFEYDLLSRLRNFLSTARNGKGGFNISSGLDSLGNPPQDVSDFYIVMVLSLRFQETQYLFKPEIEIMRTEFSKFQADRESLDSYKLAVLGIFLLNSGDTKGARSVAEALAARQNKSTGEIQKGKTTITKSTGISLALETTALTLILFARAELFDLGDTVDLALNFLTTNMKGGAYPSTQATILSLMAISDYLKALGSSNAEDLEFDVTFNDQPATPLKIKAGSLTSTCVDLSDRLKSVEGPNAPLSVSIRPTSPSDKPGRYLLSVDLEYYADLPDSVENSPLRVDVKRSGNTKTSSYEARISNTNSTDVGMTVYEFMMPSCHDININDLDNLLLRKSIDNYELRNNRSLVVFYWRGIKANSSVSFSFSTNKRYGINDCKDRTHSVYLYYDKEGSISYFKPT